MSMIRCDRCDQVFDSDADPDCFVEVGNMRSQTQIATICERCRTDDEYVYQQDENQMQMRLEEHDPK